MSAPKEWYSWGPNKEDGCWIDPPQLPEVQPQMISLVAPRQPGFSAPGPPNNAGYTALPLPQLVLPESVNTKSIVSQQPSSGAANPSHNINTETSTPKTVPQASNILKLMAEGAFGPGKLGKNYVHPKWKPLKESDALPQPAIVPAARASRVQQSGFDGHRDLFGAPQRAPGYSGSSNTYGIPQPEISTGSGGPPNSADGSRLQKHGDNYSSPDDSRRRQKKNGGMNQVISGPSNSSGLGLGVPDTGFNNPNGVLGYGGYGTGIYAPGNNISTNATQKTYVADLSDPDEGAKDIDLDEVQCCFCQQMFHSNILRRHMDEKHKVNGQIPDCPDCGKSYTTAHLMRHFENLHTVSGQLKEWRCLYPGRTKAYRTKSERNQHFKEVHLKQGTRFRCGILKPLCKGAFTSLEELRDHFAAEHPSNKFKRLGYALE